MSLHSLGTGTSVLERIWTLSQSVRDGACLPLSLTEKEADRRWVFLYALSYFCMPSVCSCPPGVFVSESVVSLRLQIGERVLTVVCAHAKNEERRGRMDGWRVGRQV